MRGKGPVGRRTSFASDAGVLGLFEGQRAGLGGAPLGAASTWALTTGGSPSASLGSCSCPQRTALRINKSLHDCTWVSKLQGLFLECRTTFAQNRHDTLSQEGGLGEMKTSSLDVN